jgi:hypothetical protein
MNTRRARRRALPVVSRKITVLSIGQMNRREFVRVGGLGVAGITLPWLLRQEAKAAESFSTAGRATSICGTRNPTRPPK